MDRVSQFSAVKVQLFENHNIARPTYIKLNDVTKMFQLIVDTYGVPRYQEANPAMFTIVTFPFFFGVMFGDMGHGSILFFFAAYLTLRYDTLKENKTWAAIGQARYLLLLMGLMAFYAGSIYNEWFALGVNMWGSCYDINAPINNGGA